MLSRPAAGLFLDPGLGKTRCALKTFEVLRAKGYVSKLVVVAPLRPCYETWPEEIDRWGFDMRVAVLHGKDKERALADRTADVYVVNYEGLEWLFERLRDRAHHLRRAVLMLVLDEVQCGVARAGKMYAHELYGITPDIVASAKGIGGGFPLGACLATEHAARGMTFGTHGSTYGGNPLAMAAGIAVMEAVANEEFLGSVRDKGARLKARLEQFIGNYPELFELVRGEGLMLGVKMKVESRPFFQHLRDNHQLLTVAAGDNTLRVLPPLVIGDAEIDEFFDKLSAGAASFTIPEDA